MSSGGTRKIEIEGVSPFKLPSGVFEVQIAICESQPPAQEITQKSFSSLWKDNFHLRVKDKKFSTVLGSDKNPLPDFVFERDSVWIVITDQFSSIHTVFESQVSQTAEKKPSESHELPKPTRELATSPKGRIGREGTLGEKGPKGSMGSPGDKGPPGPRGPQGDKGSTGDKGSSGDKGSPGDKGPSGEKGDTGDKGDKGDKGLTGDVGLRGDKGSTGLPGPTGDKGIQGPPGEKGPK
jgi:integrin beta 3/collagen type V/XI/XXIV/XXVII alpha